MRKKNTHYFLYMPVDPQTIWIYRITHFQNLEYILQNGIYYRNSPNFDPNYVNIGSSEIIGHRDTVPVKCFPGDTVNQYVPFYFGVRSPMLYKIKTGHGVPQRPQHEIIYLCCRLPDVINSNMQWCFTDGNAARYITDFYTDVSDLNQLDWKSINATVWRDDNADGDTDRMRKKHSEFLIRDHVPVDYIKGIVVLNDARRQYVQNLVQQYNLPIQIHVDTISKYYY